MKSLSLGLAALVVPVAFAAAPTSGAYVTDNQNTWVQDRVGDRIGTVNMIMCVMSAMRPDALVNQGAYRALVDENKCSGRGNGSKSGSTNAGESNATNFMSAVVVSTQASVLEPLIMKAWLTSEGEPGHKSSIYVYSVATAGKSDANSNGLFTITYCGKPAGVQSGPCQFKGVLKSEASGVSFYESEQDGSGSRTTKLALQAPSTDNGQGRVQGAENGSPFDFSFAYDTDNFRRSDGTVDGCFARDKAVADYSTWRYGTYNEDGSRLSASNPGFPVKYVNGDTSTFGFWSFWGLWLPESALATLGSAGTLTRRVGNDDQALSVVKRGGKLWKQVRELATLGSFKSVSMMYWVNQPVGSLQQGSNYELQWDGAKLVAIGTQSCDQNGCSQQPFSPPLEVSAADFRTAGVRMLPIFFQSIGGNGAVSVPETGAFAAETVLAFRSRSMVAPDASDAPTDLVCLNNCLEGDLAAAFAAQPPQPFLAHSWEPVITPPAYQFSNGMLSRLGVNIDGSTLNKDALGPFSGGLNSGAMLAQADLADVRCDVNGTPNSAGARICPGLADRATVTYEWETGPNHWNHYFGAAGVTIDPPKQLAFAAHAGNIRAVDTAKYEGTTVQLQFSGFGELQGVPGQCVNPDTNAEVPCGQNVRWVPAFDILDGSSVTSGASTYYVKYLERELRLAKLTGAAEASCKASLSLGGAASMALPDASSITVDPVLVNGTEPTPANPKPAVIDGILQG
ncbi:MAG: hypothetical protein WA210_18090 [Burkholderiaceae bacterium]